MNEKQLPTGEQRKNIDKIINICRYTTKHAVKEVFPLVEFQSEEALAKMYSCLGFLMGLAMANTAESIELAEKLSQTLLRSLWADSERLQEKRMNLRGFEELSRDRIIMLYHDSDALSFGFRLYCIIDSNEEVNLDDSKVLRIGNFNYAQSFYGGIVFHGLQKVFTVNLSGSIGWQMHT